MPVFSYQGRDAQGHPVTGRRDSSSKESVATQLIQEGISPIHIALAGSQRSFKEFLFSSVSGKIRTDEMLMFCQQMYALCKAGIPIVTSLNRIAETTRNHNLSRAISGISEGVASGQKLAVSMSRYPTIFSNLVIRLIEVGEQSGELDKAFLQVAEYLDLESRTKKKMITVFRYPAIVITGILAALIIINFMVIPAFAKVFAMFNAQLPLPTRILLGTSNFLIAHWILLLAMLISLIVIISSLMKTAQGKYLWSEYQLRLPLIGKILKKILLARFARTFSLIVRSGITLNQGLELVANAVNNLFARAAILKMSEAVERGENLTRAATNSQLFSVLTLQMISVGEETGSLDNMMKEVGDFYEREINYDIQKLTDLLEPLILLCIAGMVLVLALGVFLPMWDLTTVVK